MARKQQPSAIFQLKISLAHISPPIWRRVLVPGTFTLGDLHNLIQSSFDWADYHLHLFNVGGIEFGQPSDDDFYEVQNEGKIRLEQLVSNEKFKFHYTYDFGDDWEHTILVEKILPVDPALTYPVCIKGKRATPPEDVGGPWGYADFLETIADPENEEHEEMMEWGGEDFDPEYFDLDEINDRIQFTFQKR